jgi:ABC-type lipoprotein export system ATPase subunit
MSQSASRIRQQVQQSSDCCSSLPEPGTTVVMATHDPAAINCVDRALLVGDGALHTPDRRELILWLTDGTAIG